MVLIAETNAERGAFICSRCEKQTMKLVDCLCESCNQAVQSGKIKSQLENLYCKRCARKYGGIAGVNFIDGFCEECWNFMRPKELFPEPTAYSASSINSILDLWKRALTDKLTK